MARSYGSNPMGRPSLSDVIGTGRSGVIDLAREGRVVYMLEEGDRADGVITRSKQNVQGKEQPPGVPDNKEYL